MNTKHLWLIGLICIVLDGAITHWAVSTGIAHEANPNMQNWIDTVGLTAAVVLSVVIRFGVVGAGMILESLHDGIIGKMPAIVITPILVTPVVWNVILLW